jgi:hypothetical protein
MQEGYQCGMLWGATLATGAESYRRYGNTDQAISQAISTTNELMKSFSDRAKCIHCSNITGCDWSKKNQAMKYLITGKLFKCLGIGKKWGPEAAETANTGLTGITSDKPKEVYSCATEVARKMGATEEEMVMVSGFAGGMGLSGNACGAVTTAIWLKSLAWCKRNQGTRDMYNPDAKDILKKFYEITDAKMMCNQICSRGFKTINEHTDFIRNGGCADLIAKVAHA